MMVNVRLLLTEEALGTTSASKEVYRDYVVGKFERAAKDGKAGSMLVGGRVVDITPEEAAARGLDEAEAIAADEADARGTTVFPRMEVDGDPDVPFLYDYQLKGFFKETFKALRYADNKSVCAVKAYRQRIDGCLFPYPRRMPFMTEDGPAHVAGNCERPLRAQTPQGERVALASSEAVPAGCFVDAKLLVLDKKMWPALRECLTYGSLRGLCQWRNSGKGRFVWRITGMDGEMTKADEAHTEFNATWE